MFTLHPHTGLSRHDDHVHMDSYDMTWSHNIVFKWGIKHVVYLHM